MAEIHVLDSETIDKIAAGEVVERPSSVVKELVENALDAGANAITVEIRGGGIDMIRVTDNGAGMEKEQVRKAFLRHATSKIESADDLNCIHSLGFRGEALSSIAAVSQVELITKTADSLTGVRFWIEGGVEKEFQEIGAPDGTTFVMRNLFFNTPVRKKFLKQAPTEGSYVTDLMEHLALSRPDVSFCFVIGTQTRFHTSGNGNLNEVIYRIYGREIANSIVPVQVRENGFLLEGFLGKPILVRSNRNFEIYYVNGRFVKSSVIAKAVEEGYKEYLMQHKFPFCVLHFTIGQTQVDVNVHPTKMDVRFASPFEVTDFISRAVKRVLTHREMIPQEGFGDEKEAARQEKLERQAENKVPVAQPFEQKRIEGDLLAEEVKYQAPKENRFESSPVWERVRSVSKKPETKPEFKVEPKAEARPEIKPETSLDLSAQEKKEDVFFEETVEGKKLDEKAVEENAPAIKPAEEKLPAAEKLPEPETVVKDVKQLDLFEEKILAQNNRALYKIIGQVFDTYWMFQYQDKLCILDQHAAHEKIKYERFMKRFRENDALSQTLFPPVIVSLSGQEEATYKEYADTFQRLGFEVESFGGNEYCLRGVPVDLYGCGERELFLSVLDELDLGVAKQSPKAIEERIATMSCKAAVKGNNRLSYEEADELINELLTLDNPYNCPHGRPTIITISKYEMEKKFKRIV